MKVRVTLMIDLEETVPTTAGQIADWLDDQVTQAIDRLPNDADKIVVSVENVEEIK